MTMKLIIFGAGYSGRRIAREFAESAEWVAGTTRDPEKIAALKEDGIRPFLFDGIEIGDELRAAMAEATHLVQSIAPEKAGDPLLGIIGNDLPTWFPKLQWAAYLSTVGVYGDHGGAWVDEETPCRPVSDRSIMRVAAETAWLDAGVAAGLPVAVLRLSGIYGPGRNAFVNLRSGTARRLIKPGQVFNRIHVDDIAGATFFSAERELSGVWNVTDDQPAPPQDVVACAADLLGVAAPPETRFDEAELTPMARSFYGENKRVANSKLKKAGYRLRLPDYRSGLEALLRQESRMQQPFAD
jgi:nucleoside-diphosphate-sugar epimerase